MNFDVADIVLRTCLAFVLMLASTRLLGKKMIERMTYTDFVAAITLGSLTGAIVLDHHITLGDLILAIASFTAIVFFVTILSLKNRKIRQLIGGMPIELVRDGKILEKELRSARITMENVVQQLRLKDVFDISNVKQAFLETNGRLSVLLTPEARPLTAGQFLQGTFELPNERLPVELIIDGNVLTENLVRAQLDLAWLLQELEKKEVADSKEVAYAVLTSQSKLYVDLYRDQFGPPKTR